MGDKKLEYDVIIYARNPDVDVKYDAGDQRAEIAVGNDMDGPVFHLTLSDADAVRGFARKLDTAAALFEADLRKRAVQD